MIGSRNYDIIVNFYNNKFKNSFDVIITDISILKKYIYSSCKYSDMKNRRKNLIL